MLDGRVEAGKMEFPEALRLWIALQEASRTGPSLRSWAE